MVEALFGSVVASRPAVCGTAVFSPGDAHRLAGAFNRLLAELAGGGGEPAAHAANFYLPGGGHIGDQAHANIDPTSATVIGLARSARQVHQLRLWCTWVLEAALPCNEVRLAHGASFSFAVHPDRGWPLALWQLPCLPGVALAVPLLEGPQACLRHIDARARGPSLSALADVGGLWEALLRGPEPRRVLARLEGLCMRMATTSGCATSLRVPLASAAWALRAYAGQAGRHEDALAKLQGEGRALPAPAPVAPATRAQAQEPAVARARRQSAPARAPTASLRQAAGPPALPPPLRRSFSGLAQASWQRLPPPPPEAPDWLATLRACRKDSHRICMLKQALGALSPQQDALAWTLLQQLSLQSQKQLGRDLVVAYWKRPLAVQAGEPGPIPVVAAWLHRCRSEAHNLAGDLVRVEVACWWRWCEHPALLAPMGKLFEAQPSLPQHVLQVWLQAAWRLPALRPAACRLLFARLPQLPNLGPLLFRLVADLPPPRDEASRLLVATVQGHIEGFVGASLGKGATEIWLARCLAALMSSDPSVGSRLCWQKLRAWQALQCVCAAPKMGGDHLLWAQRAALNHLQDAASHLGGPPPWLWPQAKVLCTAVAQHEDPLHRLQGLAVYARYACREGDEEALTALAANLLGWADTLGAGATLPLAEARGHILAMLAVCRGTGEGAPSAAQTRCRDQLWQALLANSFFLPQLCRMSAYDAALQVVAHVHAHADLTMADSCALARRLARTLAPEQCVTLVVNIWRQARLLQQVCDGQLVLDGSQNSVPQEPSDAMWEAKRLGPHASCGAIALFLGHLATQASDVLAGALTPTQAVRGQQAGDQQLARSAEGSAAEASAAATGLQLSLLIGCRQAVSPWQGGEAPLQRYQRLLAASSIFYAAEMRRILAAVRARPQAVSAMFCYLPAMAAVTATAPTPAAGASLATGFTQGCTRPTQTLPHATKAVPGSHVGEKMFAAELTRALWPYLTNSAGLPQKGDEAAKILCQRACFAAQTLPEPLPPWRLLALLWACTRCRGVSHDTMWQAVFAGLMKPWTLLSADQRSKSALAAMTATWAFVRAHPAHTPCWQALAAALADFDNENGVQGGLVAVVGAVVDAERAAAKAGDADLAVLQALQPCLRRALQERGLGDGARVGAREQIEARLDALGSLQACERDWRLQTLLADDGAHFAVKWRALCDGELAARAARTANDAGWQQQTFNALDDVCLQATTRKDVVATLQALPPEREGLFFLLYHKLRQASPLSTHEQEALAAWAELA